MNEMIANRYALVQLIGEGGMASVYLAVDTILKREVAVKVLRGDLSKDNTSLVRFQREANAATKLSHPNIVEVYDVGEDHGKNFIVMEYVKGRTLKDLVRQRGALAKEEAVNIMRQLVSSVMAAHKNGIIHRDIKSQNVLIKDDGTVKLSDFGIALAADAVQLTQTDVIVGSVHYLAPELARGEQATQQSDIYALGIVFYEMLTGDVPHHGDAPVQVALKHLREQIPSVRDFNPDIPQSVDNIIRKATVKNRAYRYPTAAAMYDDLVTCLDSDRKNEKMIVFESEEPKRETEDEAEKARKSAELKKKKKKKKIVGLTTGAIIVLSVLLALAVSALLIYLMGGFHFGKPMVVIPEVRNLSAEEARVKLQDAGLYPGETLTYEMTDDLDKGKVIRTSPAEGTSVEQGSSVELYVSEGMYYLMENFVGKKLEDATKTLDACCKLKITVTYENTSDREPGIVTAQNVEEGTKINPTKMQEIRFTVTKYPVIDIPYNIVGMQVEEAKKVLEDLGVKVETVGTRRPSHMEPTTEERDTGEVDEEGNPIIETVEVDVEVFDLDESYIGQVYGTDPSVNQPYEQDAASVFKLLYYSE
ncbi:MAG: Stk1 family PASTA domain-containing Ser/Thr kinase [Erysipelotrichales bacterium]|nr:Stk1 family PASTA domain-containing Ser/Thr kinase [Erysipelotrichales bacterium]